MATRWKHVSYVVRWKLTDGNGHSRYDWVLDLREAGTYIGWPKILDHLSGDPIDGTPHGMASARQPRSVSGPFVLVGLTGFEPATP